MTTIHKFEVREQAISSITILSDRAEVNRLVKVTLEEGINEVQLKNFSNSLQHDSVRVEGRGKATICDVAEKDVPALHSETDSPKVEKLRKELDEHDAIRKKQEDQIDVLKKRIEGLDRTVTEIGKGVMNPPKEAGAVVIDENLLEGIQKLFAFHESEAGSLREQLREKEKELEKTIEVTNKIRSELDKITANQNRHSHNVIITLEAAEEGEVELDVTYQVFRAGWAPSYDIRVDTEKPTMTITYYGKIYNRSGEDWNEFSAVLSTAQPALGGHIPELGTLDAAFFRPTERRSQPKKMMMMRRGDVRGEGVNRSLELEDGQSLEERMAVPTMEVSQNALSTEFKITRKTSIPDGTDDHKVTIGEAVFTPTIVHESVPSKNAAAFLTASAVNSSSFPFIHGQTSVFLDNAFVAKSSLKDVSPGERFTCSLGVDTGIRVEYKAAKKFHEEGGYITKHSAAITEQHISVKNTRSERPILLTVKHHVPRSTDEKIRVKLIHPVAAPYDSAATAENETAEPKEGVRLNKENNLEWTMRLAPNTTKDLVVKWVVEHPKGQKIDLKEQF
ncbi:unnamed protein product [Caenorhabditis sp. 36 PRJEB53466]|nr:unnamed protein product [Caenorhabditis sp. 36 PRJEB53466]